MWKCGTAFVAALLCAAPLSAQVVRLEITSREPMNAGQPAGAAGPFELIRGRIHGEVDPRDPHNAIIQDLGLAPRNARGKVEYVATFALAKPVDLAKASRVLLYQVVNRGNGQATANAEGDITLVSGWQGDVIPTATNQTIAVPVARKKDGSPVTGRVIARFFDLPDGAHSAPIRLASLGTPQPYRPADLAQPGATLTWHTRENYAGQQDAKHTVPRADWAFADCESTPWPGTPDPSRICVKDAFRAGRFYELVYTAKDPLVLGVGLAATRDIVSFFRHAQADASGTPNPVAGVVDHTISIGDSQSGNFIRTFIHLGFNQDTQNRIVWDGAFPRIAARQTPINLRFALPGGAAGMYEPGSDGVVWWTRYADKARGLKAAGLLDRCTATKTCPKIIEAFGSAEFWGLRMSPDLIGTDATRDLPLPVERPPLLLSEHHARRRARRLPGRGDGGREQPVHAAGQSEPAGRADARADARARRLGDEGHAAAAEPLPDAGQRRPGAGDARGTGHARYPRASVQRSRAEPACCATTSAPVSTPRISRA